MKQDRIVCRDGVFAAFAHTEQGLLLRGISAEGALLPEGASLPFLAILNGETNGSFGFDSDAYACEAAGWKQTRYEEHENNITVIYERDLCTVSCNFTFVPGCAALYCSAELTARVPLTVRGLRLCLPLTGYTNKQNEEYTLSFRRNEWQGEGQWSVKTLAQLGFAAYSHHPSLSVFSVGGSASQTTARYYPSLILQSKGGGNWFMEGEITASWEASLVCRGAWGKEESVLCFTYGEKRPIIPAVQLKEGESFSVPRVLLAVSEGKDSCLRAVYAAKRQEKVRQTAPVVTVNDYMCSLWAAPEERAEMALIGAAAELGADCFVIDDGWFLYKEGQECGFRLGDWNTDGQRLGAGGIADMFSRISAAGMRAGIWMEPEVAGKNSRIFREHPDWFLQVNGAPYGNGIRYFLDFTRKEVWAYLFSSFDALYSLGARYFKLDYNDAYTASETSPSLRENYAAIRAFYKELVRRLPDAVFENCASGGKRSSGEIAGLFDVQSISDQEDYRLYPSVICGSLVNALPERLGVWSLPRPVGFYEKGKPLAQIPAPSREQVVYNLVNALAGTPCIGSRIDLLSEEDRVLVKEAMAIARQIRPFLMRAWPQYPLGLTNILHKQHELLFTDGTEGILYLWANGTRTFMLPEITKKNCRQLFPPQPDCDISKNRIALPDDNSARMFFLKLKSSG